MTPPAAGEFRPLLVGFGIAQISRGSEDGAGADDLELLASSARRGDRVALERLLGVDYSRLHAVCWKVLRDDEAALDATQDAVIAIARHISRFDGRSRYSTWSYRIAANAALDEARRARRRPVVAFGDDSGNDDGPGSAAEAEPSVGFEGEVTSRLSIADALDRLPPEQQAVLRLRHELDLDYAELAAILRVPVGTVRSRIARGRAALGVLLSGGDDDSTTAVAGRNAPEAPNVQHERPT